MNPHLYLGNRNYSSWSLRAWLAVKWSGLPFTETFIVLDQPGYGEGGIAEVLAVSPTGRVPVLVAGGVAIWDSLAIAEWAAEQAAARPGAPPLWPVDPLLRAQARSVAAEMHSGFTGMRRDLSMNIRRRCAATGLPPETLADVARIDAMWSGLRRASRNPPVPVYNARMTDSRRIEDLEVKCAFLERANQELSDVVARHQQQLDEALARLADLRRQLEALELAYEGGRPPPDPRAEVPPHY